MVRKYRGNKPAGGIVIGDDGEFELYALDSSNDEFINLKMVAKKRSKRKANFHFGWNVNEFHFTDCRDRRILRKHWPEKLAFVTRAVHHHVLIG